MSANHGIPTVLNGIRFRSRVEACWAAFFNAASWRFEYEPIDLGGYIPDFSLLFERTLLAEVKGSASLDELDEHRAKVEQSGWDGEALLLLSAPLERDGGSPVVGLLGERVAIGRELLWEWSSARLFTCLSCGSLSVLAEDGCWRCRVCGVDGGNAHIGVVEDGLREWESAKNRVQWRPQ